MPAAKTILITGCSSPQGIGLATARGLADRGHVVHATVRHHENDASLIAGYEARLRVHELDLLDRMSITAVVDAITGAGESIDVLVNNAATASSVASSRSTSTAPVRASTPTSSARWP